jgi:hypothetical protein
LPTEVPPNFIIFIRQLFDCLRKNGIQWIIFNQLYTS